MYTLFFCTDDNAVYWTRMPVMKLMCSWFCLRPKNIVDYGIALRVSVHDRGLTIVLRVIVACVSRFTLMTQMHNQTF